MGFAIVATSGHPFRFIPVDIYSVEIFMVGSSLVPHISQFGEELFLADNDGQLC